jgi:hypothetical protein
MPLVIGFAFLISIVGRATTDCLPDNLQGDAERTRGTRDRGARAPAMLDQRCSSKQRTSLASANGPTQGQAKKGLCDLGHKQRGLALRVQPSRGADSNVVQIGTHKSG